MTDARLPAHGRPRDDVLAELEAMRAGDVDWRGGRVFSLAYFAGDDVLEVQHQAAVRFMSENGLNPEAFPSLRRMQADVVAMTTELLHGGSEAAGFMTSGGTESILLAVKAARERGRAERGVEQPNMVLPTSAHAAFEKGAHYFGVRSVRVPVDAGYRADPAAMRAAVDADTVLVVASAPQYPQGVIDPVADVAAIGAERDINVHVDACMGGITLPFLERLGHPIAPWDFRVRGVTSISVDLHKYGYTAKGASVLVHRDRRLRAFQTFITDNWLGGLYGSSGILGTKSGAPMAAAWAVMQYLGEDGYLRVTAAAKDAADRLITAIGSIRGLAVRGDPDATLVAFGGDGSGESVDAWALGDLLVAKGWYLDRQGPPPSLHATVHAGHVGTIDALIADLAEGAASLRGTGHRGEAAAYGAVE